MSSDAFRLEPTSQAEIDELTADGAAFIKRKLEEAALHIPNVHEVWQIAEEQGLTNEQKYMVLAYRALVDVIRVNTLHKQNTIEDVSPVIKPPEGLILPK